MGIFLGSLGVTEFLKMLEIHSKFILLPPLFASGYCLLSSVKEYRDLRNRGRVSKVRKLIQNLNDFDSSLRKQIMFLREISLFRGKIKCSEEWEGNLAVKTIQSIRKVTLLIYNEIRDLEEKLKIPTRYQGIYQPLDNLEDCEYFQKTEEEFQGRHIKEFFNIFLYIQSEFLLRIPFIVASQDNGFFMCEKNISKICQIVQKELKENSENLDYFLQPISTDLNRFSLDNNQAKGQMHQFSCLKSASGTILTKFLALATQLKIFDGNLQAVRPRDEESLRKDLQKMKESLETLSVTFTCINLEFENLHLIYNKILNLPSKALEDVQTSHKSSEEPGKKIEDLTVNPATDEFFHLDASKEADWEKPENDFDLADYEYDRVNQKLIKSTFKPVLVQLRKRIHPLHDAMKEREKQFLQNRGVPLPDDSDGGGDFSDSLDEKSNSESDEEDSLSQKHRTKPGKYEENREFLQEKQQIGLFFSLPPPQNLLSEDVLE